jgi:hypothetical protein
MFDLPEVPLLNTISNRHKGETLGIYSGLTGCCKSWQRSLSLNQQEDDFLQPCFHKSTNNVTAWFPRARGELALFGEQSVECLCLDIWVRSGYRAGVNIEKVRDTTARITGRADVRILHCRKS